MHKHDFCDLIQYADDTIITLDGSKEDLQETLFFLMNLQRDRD